VLGEFTRKDEPDGSLDLTGRHGSLVAVSAETTTLTSDTVESVSDQVVENSHGFLADASLGVDLLQNPHDVDRVGLRSLSVRLLSDLLHGT